VLLGALRRLATLTALSICGACVLGLVIAAAAGEDIRRGLAIGLYVSGAGLTGLAFLFGSRPPVRGREEQGGFVTVGRWLGGGVRWASPEEHQHAMNLPAVFLGLGVLLILIGVGVDDRH
jgi:hypothetical protein